MDGKRLDQLTREELYEKLWSTPASKLATEFGISDVAFAKRCKKLNVPRPPRGYWAKVAAGESPHKAKLPPPKPDSALAEALSFEDPNLPASKRGMHSAATDLLNALREVTPDSEGRVTAVGRTIPKVTVSKHLIVKAALTCSPKTEPGVMRVLRAEKAGKDFHEAQEAQT